MPSDVAAMAPLTAGSATGVAAAGAATPVILSRAELPRLAAEANTNEKKHQLRAEARQWLNELANSDGPKSTDLTQIWPQWNCWLALQHQGTTSFHADVVRFTADRIENTRDANRGGLQRLDFCAHLADGSYWRFHPALKARQDAAPVFMPAILRNETSERGATEHAHEQWVKPGDSGVWTWEHRLTVPQIDYIGKKQMWQIILPLLEDQTIPHRPNSMDISTSTTIPWWLWVCNLGKHSGRVIGNGIEKVFLSRSNDREALFEFVHNDTTRVNVFIAGSKVRITNGE